MLTIKRRNGEGVWIGDTFIRIEIRDRIDARVPTIERTAR